MADLIPPSLIERAASLLRYYNQLQALQGKLRHRERFDFKVEASGQGINPGLVDFKEATENWVGKKIAALEIELAALGVAVEEPEIKISTEADEEAF